MNAIAGGVIFTAVAMTGLVSGWPACPEAMAVLACLLSAWNE